MRVSAVAAIVSAAGLVAAVPANAAAMFTQATLYQKLTNIIGGELLKPQGGGYPKITDLPTTPFTASYSQSFEKDGTFSQTLTNGSLDCADAAHLTAIITASADTNTPTATRVPNPFGLAVAQSDFQYLFSVDRGSVFSFAATLFAPSAYSISLVSLKVNITAKEHLISSTNQITASLVAGERYVLDVQTLRTTKNHKENPQVSSIAQCRFAVTVADATSGVPQPTTWSMMLLGFGGVGAAVRRRNKVAAAVT